MAKLMIQIPDGEEVVYDFDEPQITVGRSEDNSIPIPHGSLSGAHAQLTQNPDGSYTLTDLGSTNGTFVNGQQVTNEVLPEFAEVIFGQVGASYYQNASGAEAASQGGMEAAPGGFSIPELAERGIPANFRSISPFPKPKPKKDPLGGIALLLGGVSLVASLGLVAAVFLLFK